MTICTIIAVSLYALGGLLMRRDVLRDTPPEGPAPGWGWAVILWPVAAVLTLVDPHD